MNRAIHSVIYVGLLVLLIARASHAAFVSPFISNCTTISQSGSYAVINNIDARTAILPQLAAGSTLLPILSLSILQAIPSLELWNPWWPGFGRNANR